MLSTSQTALTSFYLLLKKRSAYRTPLLDTVLVALEEAAADLKADMRGLPDELYGDYRERAGDALTRAVKVLERLLESMGPERGDGVHGIEAELLVGRVALYLAKASTFLEDIGGEAKVKHGE